MTVSSASQTFMGVSAFICIGAPFIYWLVLREKLKLRYAIFGLLSYFVFVLILEGRLHEIFLVEGGAIMSNRTFYVIYIGLIAAIIEEGVRYAFFRFYLKDKDERADAAIGFAIGFALPELLIAGITALSNFSLTLMLNENGIDYVIAESATTAIEEMRTALELLCTTPSSHYLLSGADRMFFLAQQVSMSVIVWYAVKREDSAYLFPAALLIHMISSMPAAFYQFDRSVSLYTVETIYFVLVTLTVFLAVTLYNKHENTDSRGMNPERLKARTKR